MDNFSGMGPDSWQGLLLWNPKPCSDNLSTGWCPVRVFMTHGSTTTNQNTAVSICNGYTQPPPLQQSSYRSKQWCRLCSHFWNYRDRSLTMYGVRGVLINSACHGDIPCDRPMVAIWSQHKDELLKGMVLLEDVACLPC
jgi:hypothetical protein